MRPAKVTVAVLSGLTFAGTLMVALLPIDIGKSATLIISIKKVYGKCNSKDEKGFKNINIFYHNHQ